jgi:tetratricopeptide (TPR) repeat protein
MNKTGLSVCRSFAFLHPSSFIIHPSLRRAAVSGNEVKQVEAVPARAGRRWYRSLWFEVLAAVLVLGAVGGGLYFHFRRPVPEPPEVNLEGVDPAIKVLIEQARQRVRKEPESADAWGQFGMVLVVHEFRPAGIICLAHAERLDPSEVRWPYFQALAHLRGAEMDEALPKLEKAVEIGGDLFDAPRVRLAELLLSLQRLDEAETHFRHLLKVFPGHPRAQVGMARICSQRGQLQKALEYLALPQHDRRTRKSAHQLLAEIYHQLGNRTAAEETKRRAAELPEDPYWPDALNQEATDLRTGKNAWLKRAQIMVNEGRETEGITLYQNVVRDYPEADDAWLQLGQAYLKVKDGKAAVEALRRAVEFAPQSHINRFYLGAALVVAGEMPEATACFRKAIELKSDYGPAHYNLGNCLVHAGDRTAAIDAYRAAVRCQPDLVEAHLNLANLLAEKGQNAEALVHARLVLKLKPGHAQARKLVERLGP